MKPEKSARLVVMSGGEEDFSAFRSIPVRLALVPDGLGKGVLGSPPAFMASVTLFAIYLWT